MKMATKVTTPKATESRNDVFITDQGSIRVSRSRARRGWRPDARRARLPRAAAGPALARCSSAALDSVSCSRSVRDRLAGSSPERTAGSRGAVRHGYHSSVSRRRGHRQALRQRPDPRLLHRRPRRAIRLRPHGRLPRPRRRPRQPLLDLLVLAASTERATTATVSPFLGVTNFTPMVERPVARKLASIGLRTTWPPLVIERTSSPSSTMNAPTRPPRSSLASLTSPLMPMPPRDWSAVVGDAAALGEAAVGDGEDVLLLHLARPRRRRRPPRRPPRPRPGRRG